MKLEEYREILNRHPHDADLSDSDICYISRRHLRELVAVAEAASNPQVITRGYCSEYVSISDDGCHISSALKTALDELEG